MAARTKRKSSATKSPVYYRKSWSPDGRRIAIVESGGGLMVFDVEQGAQLFSHRNPDFYVDGATFAPDGQHLAVVGSVSLAAEVRLLDLFTRGWARGPGLAGTDPSSKRLRWSADGRRVAGFADSLQEGRAWGQVWSWEPHTLGGSGDYALMRVEDPEPGKPRVGCLGWDARGSVVLAYDDRVMAWPWKTEALEQICPVDLPGLGKVMDLAGEALAVGACANPALRTPGTLGLLNLATRELKTIAAPALDSVRLSADHRQVFALTDFRFSPAAALRWNTGESSATSVGLDGDELDVPELSPDGGTVAYTSRSKAALRLRNLETGADLPLWRAL